jgi:hypothetical protein
MIKYIRVHAEGLVVSEATAAGYRTLGAAPHSQDEAHQKSDSRVLAE